MTEGNCWLWPRGKSHGYGIMWSGGRNWRVHRVIYEGLIGPIPAGMQVDHICHVKACCNPKHLRLATNKQNNEHHRGAQRNSKSGVRGVRWHKGRWVAEVKHNYKSIYVGSFTDLAEAEAAVIAKRNELFTHNDADRQG